MAILSQNGPLVGPTARELRSRIAVNRLNQTSDGAGGYSNSWSTLIASRWAKLEPMRPRRGGGVEVIAMRLQGTGVFDCWVRWDSLTKTIRPGDQVVDLRDTTRVYAVHFAEDMDQRRQWILLQLERGVAT